MNHASALNLPAHCCTLDAEEMLYLDGGAFDTTHIADNLTKVIKYLVPDAAIIYSSVIKSVATQASLWLYGFILGSSADKKPDTLAGLSFSPAAV